MLEDSLLLTKQDIGTAKNMTREFIVEFLGSLVPGVAFLLAMIPAFGLPLVYIFYDKAQSNTSSTQAFQPSAPLSLGSVLFLILPAIIGFLTFAYIAGHLFYRQDPKRPDYASFRRLPRHKHHDGMVRPIAEGGDTPVEFPYHFLKQYLLDRGINYLAKHVPWDEKNFSKRSKHFANALKIRILLESPNSYATLARNEAHVRLSSSMWYVCLTLIFASTLGFVTSLIVIIAKRRFCPVCLFPSITGILSYLAMWVIERALHYQREREVLFILETAHWLETSGRSPKIFEDLSSTRRKKAQPSASASVPEKN